MGQKKAIRPLLIMGMCIALVVTYFMTDEPAQEARSGEEKLAQTLQQIEGVGDVVVYFHTAADRQTTLSSYFRYEEETGIGGVLIVAEGATNPKMIQLLQNSVSQILQLPKHRIVIVPMEMGEEEK